MDPSNCCGLLSRLPPQGSVPWRCWIRPAPGLQHISWPPGRQSAKSPSENLMMIPVNVLVTQLPTAGNPPMDRRCPPGRLLQTLGWSGSSSKLRPTYCRCSTEFTTVIVVILVILVMNCCRHREQCLQVGRLPQAAAEPAAGVSPSSHMQVPIHAGHWTPGFSVRGTGKGGRGHGGDHGLGAPTSRQPRTWALGFCSLSAFLTTVLREGSFLFGKTDSVKISVQDAELRLGPAPPISKPRCCFPYPLERWEAASE